MKHRTGMTAGQRRRRLAILDVVGGITLCMSVGISAAVVVLAWAGQL